MATTRIFSLMVALSAAFFVLSCSGSKSEVVPETNLGTGDFRMEIEQVLAGEVMRSELLFDSPDSWRIIADPVLGDVIVVGRQAWKLENGRWVQESYDLVRSFLLVRVMDSKIPADASRSKGPLLGGESTSRWTVEKVPVGSNMASAIRRGADRGVVDVEGMANQVDGATVTLEYIVGNDSGRVYEYRFSPDDDRLAGSTFTVHYEDVTILAP
jgi:hypothetical protein